jgi:hypothetical protein
LSILLRNDKSEIKTNVILADSFFEPLKLSWNLSYFFAGKLKLEGSDLPLFEEVKITDENIDIALLFFEELIARPFGQFLGQSRVLIMTEKLKFVFLTENTTSLYYLKGSPVGLLSTISNYSHINHEKPVTHIAYIAIKKDLLTKEEQNSLKNKFIFKLNKISNNGIISARIHWFNKISLGFFKKLGLSPEILEIEKL